MTTANPAKQGGRSTLPTTIWSLAGLAGGLAAGSFLGSHPGPVLPILNGIGTLWMNALRMVALPLALGNTVCAMSHERMARAAGRIGGAIALYLALLLLGAGLVVLVAPPVLHAMRMDRENPPTPTQTEPVKAGKQGNEKVSEPTLGDMVSGLIPRNLVQSAANEDYLKLLIFAILFGLALRKASPDKGSAVTRFVEGVTETMMVLVRWIVQCSPVAMFALAAGFAAKSGGHLVGILGRFVVLECGLMLVFLALLYPITMLAGGLSLREFAEPALAPQMVAISTRSSLACLPSMLEAGEKMLPANRGPSQVILPLAVNIFKVNRTVSGLCRLFTIWYFWSIPTSAAHLFTFLVTIVVLSFSDLGLPGGPTARTLPAYLAAGCPIEAVVLLEVAEPLSDVCKTLVNVTGDLSIAAIITRWSARPALAKVMTAAPALTS